MASASDPRLPSAAKPYTAPGVAAQDLPPDYSSLIAILFGMAGVVLRYKAASWLSVVFWVHSLANMRNAENDLKQIVMAATFAVMGLITNYLGPAPRGSPPPNV